MSYLAQRAVLDRRSLGYVLALRGPALARTGLLAAFAAVLALAWWRRGAGLPASWQLPPPEALLLLPAAPVVGLLALRGLLGLGVRNLTTQHLVAVASRWAALLAVVTAGWLLHTLSGLYGTGLGGLLRADNLVAVGGASAAAGAQLTLLWVALLVALFARKLGSGPELLGLLALVLAAVLNAAPVVPAGHGHETATHPVVLAAGSAQLLAFALWLGALAALPHLRTPATQLGRNLHRSGVLVGAAALGVGVAGTVAGVVRPDRPVPVLMSVGQLAAVALVAAVTHRHRRRTLEVVVGGPKVLLVLHGAGEVVALTAITVVAAVLPLG